MLVLLLLQFYFQFQVSIRVNVSKFGLQLLSFHFFLPRLFQQTQSSCRLAQIQDGRFRESHGISGEQLQQQLRDLREHVWSWHLNDLKMCWLTDLKRSLQNSRPWRQRIRWDLPPGFAILMCHICWFMPFFVPRCCDNTWPRWSPHCHWLSQVVQFKASQPRQVRRSYSDSRFKGGKPRDLIETNRCWDYNLINML